MADTISIRILVLAWLFVLLKADACLKGKQPLVNDRWKEITVDSVLKRVPELKDNMQPSQTARIINEISSHIRKELAMIAYTVIDGKVRRMDCFSFTDDCSNYTEGLLIKEFINQFSGELAIKDMYFVAYNRIDVSYETVRPGLNAYAYNQPSFERAYDHTCQLILSLPAVRMSVDLGSGLLEQNSFLIPDSHMLYGFRSMDQDKTKAQDPGRWESILKEARKASKNIPWQLKSAKAFWRGADSGKASGISDDEVWAELAKYHPRVELVRLASLYPDKIDAMLTYHSSDPNEVVRYVKLGLQDHFTNRQPSITDHVHYKYLVSDGWTVPWILATNCVLLKQETLKVEWFDYALKPYVHYYPVKRDLSNLLEVIDYLEKHQEEAQEITRNANQFAKVYFVQGNITDHAKKVFRDYARIQNYTFSGEERALIQEFGMPYHTFASYPGWKKGTTFGQLRIDKVIRWLNYTFATFALLILLITLRVKLQSIILQRRANPHNPEIVTSVESNSVLVDEKGLDP